MHRNVETFLVGNHPSRVGYWKFWAGRIERRARDLIVVMKDGHRQTIPVAEITKIEFKDADIVVFRDGRRVFACPRPRASNSKRTNTPSRGR
jgi:hypothetical protein